MCASLCGMPEDQKYGKSKNRQISKMSKKGSQEIRHPRFDLNIAQCPMLINTMLLPVPSSRRAQFGTTLPTTTGYL